ncbi:uncharacterized protein LOC111623564 [Centruroides sculpturatus]|uniref:uncharacterized protein LOC111623564 n=1 Tax=Centruroides sculpturatus TaxID=218467 RepID=UPI000C6D34CD|nr:uncharacterized protein LOC111623564 [Centruroides sculpturatus]
MLYFKSNKKRDSNQTWMNIKKSKQWLKDNNLVLTRADKSKDVVIMKRNTYDELLLKYINETKCITAHPRALERLQTRIKQFAKTPLAKELGMTKIVVTSPSMPRLFGFAKTHKIGKSIRPVVDKGDSPTIILERLLKGFINTHLPTHNYSIKNPLELLHKLKTIKPQEVSYMTVLDFKALYPSIKLEPCFCHLRDFLLNKIKNTEKKRKQILELTHLTTYSSIFNFKGVTYAQQKGVAMGSPIAGTLCEMVLRTLENNIIPKYGMQIVLYARYVDDVLIIWKAKPILQQFIKDINDNNFGLEIELEQENDKIIHFLDLSLQIDKGDITTKVYRKPTYNPLFIPWNSHDPATYKLAAFRALIARAHSHCSKRQDRNEEMQYIKKLARQFGVNIKAITNKTKTGSNELNLRNKREEYTMMEYRAQLNNIYKRIGAATKKKIIYKRNPTVYQMLRTDKDEVDGNLLPGVYRVPITDKRRQKELFYIGATGRSLKERMIEHKRNIRNEQPVTALATYILADPTEVKAEWDKAKLVQKIHDKRHLKYAEAWHICKNSQEGQAINFREASKISEAWRSSLI